MGRRITSDDARTLLGDGGLVVGVRPGGESSAGCLQGNLNLARHHIPVPAAERLPSDRPLLACRASGTRSAMVVQYLCRLGFQAHDLGPWIFFPEVA